MAGDPKFYPKYSETIPLVCPFAFFEDHLLISVFHLFFPLFGMPRNLHGASFQGQKNRLPKKDLTGF